MGAEPKFMITMMMMMMMKKSKIRFISCSSLRLLRCMGKENGMEGESRRASAKQTRMMYEATSANPSSFSLQSLEQACYSPWLKRLGGEKGWQW